MSEHAEIVDESRSNGAATEVYNANGELVISPERVKQIQNTWFTRDRACSHLKVSKRKLDHMITTEQIPPGKCVKIKGAWWFDPDHLDHVKADVVDELDLTDPNFMRGLAEVLRANVGGVSAYQEHVEKFVVKLLDGVDRQGNFLQSLLTDSRSENTRLTARIIELESKLAAQFQAFEDAASRQNERDLTLVAETKRQDRISDMFGLAKEYVPRLLEQVAGIRKIKRMVAGLKDAEIDMLVASGKVDDDMATQLRAIRADEHARTERAAKALGVKLPDEKQSSPAKVAEEKGAGSEQKAAPSSEPASGSGGGAS
jgi:hypothetical protein